jgi:hypothetical protein
MTVVIVAAIFLSIIFLPLLWEHLLARVVLEAFVAWWTQRIFRAIAFSLLAAAMLTVTLLVLFG